MTRTEMLAYMDEIFVDSARTRFSATQRGYALNSAQLKTAILINNNYLSNLKVLDESQTVTNGLYELTSLSKTLLGGESAILNVWEHDGKESRKYSYDEICKLNNTYFAPTKRKPGHYFKDFNIFIQPTSISAIDILYIRVPTSIISSGDCGLNEILHDIVLNLAVASLFKTEAENVAKGISIENSAYDDIKMFNKKYEVVEVKEEKEKL